MNEKPVIPSLGTALVRGVEQQNQVRRQKRRRLAGSAVTMLAVATLGAGALYNIESEKNRGASVVAMDTSKQTEQKALLIALRGDAFEVTLQEISADPAKIQQELRDAGIDAVVKAAPTSPSMVGRLAFGEGGFEEANGTLLLKKGQSYALEIGRPSGDDENYASSAISVFQKGESLHCSGLETETDPAKLESALAGRGFSVSWRYTGPSTDGTELRKTRPDGVVRGMGQINAKTMIVFVYAPGNPVLAMPNEHLQFSADCAK